MRPFILLLTSAVSIVAITAGAHATLTASTILNDFNAVIYTNASTSSEVEGAAVIGGNLNLNSATIFSRPPRSQLTGFGALTVYGNTSGNTINIDNGGNAYVGGTRGATISFNGGLYTTAAPPDTIANFETPLNALSQSLMLLAPTASLPTLGNNTVFSAVPGANGIAVFDITGAQLATQNLGFSINLNGATSVVFNVSGNSDFSANDQSVATGADNIIWNFYDATSVTIGDQLGGTVLAPNATVTNNNQIDGTLVANVWTGNGELHNDPFTGTLPPAPVPEPTTLAILGVGLAALGLIRLRQTA